jgi:hypothetical protein
MIVIESRHGQLEGKVVIDSRHGQLNAMVISDSRHRPEASSSNQADRAGLS